MTVIMKDGTEVLDSRLGRLVDFDARSKGFPIRSTFETKTPRANYWRCRLRLDQGVDGMCTGAGVSHELAACPAEVPGLDINFAREKIYWEAQKEDPWEGGAYPGASPRYEGSSVLAAVKVAQRLGYFDNYRWAFSLQDLILGVGYNGPAVMGTVWYEGMSDPDVDGLIRPAGRLIGGHCYLIDQVIPKKKLFGGLNSWGTKFGVDGRFYISFDDMEMLQHEGGEAVFMLKRHCRPRG